ncbi:MAG TPA: hypothetical protein VGE74_12480 [Gemmata sp.]
MILFVTLILALTAHISGEARWERGAPFWRYFTRCFNLGAWVSDPLGRALFVGLWLIQVALAVAWLAAGSESALWLLVGAMSGDVMLSHGLLVWRFPREMNPGRRTALLYVPLIVVVFVLFPFCPVLFGLGWGAFGGFWLGAFALRQFQGESVEH